MRLTSEVENNGTWYTDSNGREWQRRVRNHRDTYNWTATEPTAGNYCQLYSRLHTHTPLSRMRVRLLTAAPPCVCCV